MSTPPPVNLACDDDEGESNYMIRVLSGLGALAGFSLFVAYIQADLTNGWPQYWRLAFLDASGVLAFLAIFVLLFRAIDGTWAWREFKNK